MTEELEKSNSQCPFCDEFEWNELVEKHSLICEVGAAQIDEISKLKDENLSLIEARDNQSWRRERAMTRNGELRIGAWWMEIALKTALKDLKNKCFGIGGYLAQHNADVSEISWLKKDLSTQLSVPQTYGEAIQVFGELPCEGHEWDNRTSIENLKWLNEIKTPWIPVDEKPEYETDFVYRNKEGELFLVENADFADFANHMPGNGAVDWMEIPTPIKDKEG